MNWKPILITLASLSLVGLITSIVIQINEPTVWDDECRKNWEITYELVNGNVKTDLFSVPCQDDNCRVFILSNAGSYSLHINCEDNCGCHNRTLKTGVVYIQNINKNP